MDGWDACLIKTDATGTIVWQKNYGGTGLDQGFKVKQASDGGYVVVGQTENFPSIAYVFKTNNSGNTSIFFISSVRIT